MGISYGTLAKRVKSEAQQPAASIGFVECSGAELLGPAVQPGAVLELSDALGHQVIVRMSGGEWLDLVGLVAAFCGVRP